MDRKGAWPQWHAGSKKIFWCNIARHCSENIRKQYCEVWTLSNQCNWLLSLMDKISDSDSEDTSSILVGATNGCFLNVIHFFDCVANAYFVII